MAEDLSRSIVKRAAELCSNEESTFGSDTIADVKFTVEYGHFWKRVCIRHCRASDCFDIEWTTGTNSGGRGKEREVAFATVESTVFFVMNLTKKTTEEDSAVEEAQLRAHEQRQLEDHLRKSFTMLRDRRPCKKSRVG
jgi:hypothetical protein